MNSTGKLRHVSHVICCIIKSLNIIIMRNKEIQIMTENEIMLLDTIKNHPNPEQAMLIAVEIILSFLNHPESTASKSSAAVRESV